MLFTYSTQRSSFIVVSVCFDLALGSLMQAPFMLLCVIKKNNNPDDPHMDLSIMLLTS